MITSVYSTIEDSSDQEFMLWIYEEFHKLMFYTARKYVSDQYDCEEIVQESLTHLIEKIDTLRGKKRSMICGYIVSTVKNTSINYINRQAAKDRRTVSLEDGLTDQSDTLELSLDELIQRKDVGETLLAVLEQLPASDQLLLEGKYFLDYSDEELAEQLGCKPGSIRMKLTRARRTMLKLLAEKMDKEEGSL